MSESLRARVYRVLEDDGLPSAARRICNIVFVAIVAEWLAEGVFRTLPGLGDEVRADLRNVEIAVGAVFAIEYVLRLWAAPERYHEGAMPASRARRNYALSWLGIVDLLVVAVFWIGDIALGFAGGTGEFLELFAVFKLTRYFPGVDLVLSVFLDRGAADGSRVGPRR